MKKSERYRLSKAYNKLYKKANVSYNCCFYCRDDKEVLDHVPPISKVEAIGIQNHYNKGGRFLLYPSCRLCNLTLYDFASDSEKDRIKILISRYERKIKNKPKWTQEELSELGFKLRKYVEKRQFQIRNVEVKLLSLYKRLDKLNNL